MTIGKTAEVPEEIIAIESITPGLVARYAVNGSMLKKYTKKN